MSQNLTKLLFGVFASMLLGYLLRPCYNMLTPAPIATVDEETTETAVVQQEPEVDILNEPDEKEPVVVHTGTTRDDFVAAELDDEDGLGYEDEEEDDDDALADSGADWTVARDSDSFVPDKAQPADLKPIREANVQVDPKEEVVPIACSFAYEF